VVCPARSSTPLKKEPGSEARASFVQIRCLKTSTIVLALPSKRRCFYPPISADSLVICLLELSPIITLGMQPSLHREPLLAASLVSLPSGQPWRQLKDHFHQTTLASPPLLLPSQKRLTQTLAITPLCLPQRPWACQPLSSIRYP
jgi:hypothetical protein